MRCTSLKKTLILAAAAAAAVVVVLRREKIDMMHHHDANITSVRPSSAGRQTTHGRAGEASDATTHISKALAAAKNVSGGEDEDEEEEGALLNCSFRLDLHKNWMAGKFGKFNFTMSKLR